MKKLMIALVGFAAFAVMAGHDCGGHARHGCGGCGGNNGVRLATDIVDLVGASLNVLAPRAVVAVPVETTPVVAAPVVVASAAYPCCEGHYRTCRPHHPCRPGRPCDGGCRR